MSTITIGVTPIGKPRMTRKDKWSKRPETTKYWAFKDALVLQCKKNKVQLNDILIADFHIPMPKSWSKKKKTLMNHKPHQQKPDVDNICKGVMDALLKEDSHIYKIDCEKYWAEEGSIVFYTGCNRSKCL